MTIQAKFEAIARRLFYVQRRLWREDRSDEVNELSRMLDDLRDKIDQYYGPKIAREITYTKDEI